MNKFISISWKCIRHFVCFFLVVSLCVLLVTQSPIWLMISKLFHVHMPRLFSSSSKEWRDLTFYHPLHLIILTIVIFILVKSQCANYFKQFQSFSSSLLLFSSFNVYLLLLFFVKGFSSKAKAKKWVYLDCPLKTIYHQTIIINHCNHLQC